MSDDLAQALVPLGTVGLLSYASGEVHQFMPNRVGALTVCGLSWDEPDFDDRFAVVAGPVDCPDCRGAHQLAADLTARTDMGTTDDLRRAAGALLLAAHVLDEAPWPKVR